MNTTYTFDENIVSDLYKEINGCRPREYFWSTWNDASDDEKQVIWDNLCDDHEHEMAREKVREEDAHMRLLERIQTAYAWGAKDKVQALRWIMEAEEFDEYDMMYGPSYFCYHFGIGYFREGSLPIQEAMNQMKSEVI